MVTTDRLSNQTNITQNVEELPANAPIFEGYLYFQRGDKWVWRLFRFDGSSLICLLPKKIKALSSCTLDLQSCISASATSLLLATPKDRLSRLSTESDLCKDASYYQLPKWTLNVCDISAITILKCSQNNLFKRKSKSLCIRSLDGQCYMMKARTLSDLERWAFVLCKMRKLSLPDGISNNHCVSPGCHGSALAHPPKEPTTRTKTLRQQDQLQSRLMHSFLSTDKVFQIQDWLSSIRENPFFLGKNDRTASSSQVNSRLKNETKKLDDRSKKTPFNFFQDVSTDESEPDRDYTYCSLIYHTSIRGQNVKLIKNELDEPRFRAAHFSKK
ncbi:hypothetical protein G6F56_003165 [Rhizopus delemar]|uniref:PH domain-containing protein n=1 Tax=Rhizopus stolonifer TaxID=4846 RepID=A0A367KHL1_RHIST|nr:hypothetical protein G6F56_003165 [Rhizopus delemar]RCI01667.1 hypothetical protein CU098_006360 [Rhizopus stolonifer]